MHALAEGRIGWWLTTFDDRERIADSKILQRPSLAATSLAFIHLYKREANHATGKF